MRQIGDPELKRHLISLCTPKFRVLRKASRVRGGTVVGSDQFYTAVPTAPFSRTFQ